MYQKIYITSATGQLGLHALRTAGHIRSWEGCDLANGSWVGVVYPASSFARAECDKIAGIVTLPAHLNASAMATPDQLKALPAEAASTIKVQAASGRDLAQALFDAYAHPALHPDT